MLRTADAWKVLRSAASRPVLDRLLQCVRLIAVLKHTSVRGIGRTNTASSTRILARRGPLCAGRAQRGRLGPRAFVYPCRVHEHARARDDLCRRARAAEDGAASGPCVWL